MDFRLVSPRSSAISPRGIERNSTPRPCPDNPRRATKLVRSGPAHYAQGMHRTLHRLAAIPLAALLALVTLPAVAQDYLPPCPGGRDPGLWALMNRALEQAYEADPVGIGALLGDHARDDELGDDSAAAIEARNRQTRVLLDDLAGLDRTGFSERDVLAADLLAYQWRQDLALAKYKPWQTPVNSVAGPQVWLPQIGDQVSTETRQNLADYVTRLKRVPIVVGDAIDNMRLGMSEGRVPPRVVVEPTPAQALAQASPEFRKDPGLSPFYAPLRKLAAADPIAVEARQVIAQRIIPVYMELALFLQNEYLPACRVEVGAAQGADGVAAYNAMLAAHTTMPDLTAEQIHQIGLDEVHRIRGEMLEVIRQTGWYENQTGGADPGPSRTEGDDERLFEEFVKFLRTPNPRFYYDSEQELLDRYKVIAKTIDPELPRLFGKLPRLSYGVRPLPGLAAESAPSAYYFPGAPRSGQPGFFMANLTHLDQRPRYEMLALTMHEAVPGHHLQIALAQEIEGQHPIRKAMGFTAFVEGWALYAERLGLEMGDTPNGLYSDPYDNFGRLNFEMWRALRLVVDTGIHAKGWSRQRAIEYMEANSALSVHNIEAEVDRYIGWPGQATGYKIGELEILKIRHEAEVALGDAFDIRAFHDALLSEGPLPMPVLRQNMSRWIESRRPGAGG